MKNKSKFVPIEGDRYFFIDAGGGIKNHAYCDDNVDEWIIKHYLVFRTYDECEEYKHFLELLDEYTFKPDWDDDSQDKWYIYYDHERKQIDLMWSYHMQYKQVYFDSHRKSLEFIEKVDEDAIKRFMFDYWE